MATFGWAYVDCTETDGAFTGPTGSVLFVTGTRKATGSLKFRYYTASYAGNPPSTLVLSGNMVISGTISASVYNYRDIAVIDATGSTYFGNTADDVHVRKGSLSVLSGATTTLLFSASAKQEKVWVRGFGGKFIGVGASANPYYVSSSDYILGVTDSNNVTIYLPSASTMRPGAFLLVKDQAPSRGANVITISASVPPGGFKIDNSSFYKLAGTMPAISLYSDGSHWYVF
tara:strand:- start:284 stop:973 length:690 start_codon:yes stop_codon:yes gene_type:complete